MMAVTVSNPLSSPIAMRITQGWDEAGLSRTADLEALVPIVSQVHKSNENSCHDTPSHSHIYQPIIICKVASDNLTIPAGVVTSFLKTVPLQNFSATISCDEGSNEFLWDTRHKGKNCCVKCKKKLKDIDDACAFLLPLHNPTKMYVVIQIKDEIIRNKVFLWYPE